MIVKCISNSVEQVPEAQRSYAITQDDAGQLDVSTGMHYIVFGTKHTPIGSWYLVHTDKQNTDTLWWMPTSLYEIIDDSRPTGWVSRVVEGDTIDGYSSLEETEEGIIDGEREPMRKYMAEVIADPTFPTSQQLNKWNAEFDRQQAQLKYNQDKALTKDRGYEWPKKSEDKDTN